MVALDDDGVPVHEALLWNDVRSARAATELVEEVGGADRCAELTGSVFNASYTITKLRWMRDHEPDAVARIHDVMLPHDYVTLAPGRPRRRADDRPRRRLRHRLLVALRRRLPAGPARAGAGPEGAAAAHRGRT